MFRPTTFTNHFYRLFTGHSFILPSDTHSETPHRLRYAVSVLSGSDCKSQFQLFIYNLHMVPGLNPENLDIRLSKYVMGWEMKKGRESKT